MLREIAETLVVHYYCEDSWYSCPQSPEGSCNEAKGKNCDCGYSDRLQLTTSKLREAYAAGERAMNERCAIMAEERSRKQSDAGHWTTSTEFENFSGAIRSLLSKKENSNG